MPRIPILPRPPLALVDGGAETDGGPAPLPPETAAGLRTLAARTARIDRELAVSQSWLSGHERLARAEDAPQGPPSGFLRSFLDDADRDRETALKTELPDDAKDALGLDLLELRATFADRAAEAEADGLALRRRLSLHETLEGYRTGVARDPGLYDGAAERMTALVADLGLPEDRRADLARHATDRLANAAVDGLMGDPERAERLLSEGLFDDALSDGSKALRLQEARDLSSRQRLLARESRVADLAARASDGALAEDALTAAERDGAPGPAEAARLRETGRAAVEAAALKDARIARVAQAADPFDPLDPEDRAAVSAYWDSVSEVHGAGDPEAQRRTELAFVDRTGVLPEGLRKRYQGELLSADGALAVTGAETLAALAAKDPALVADVPPGQVRKATIVAGFAELGLPPERAIELADAEMERGDDPPDPETPAIRFAANQNGDAAAPPGEAVPDEDGIAVVERPDGAVTITDTKTDESVDVPPDLVDAIREADEKNPEAVDLVARMLAAAEAAEGGADRDALLSELDAEIDRVFPTDDEADPHARWLNWQFKRAVRKSLQDPDTAPDHANNLIHQLEPRPDGENLVNFQEHLEENLLLDLAGFGVFKALRILRRFFQQPRGPRSPGSQGPGSQGPGPSGPGSGGTQPGGPHSRVPARRGPARGDRSREDGTQGPAGPELLPPPATDETGDATAGEDEPLGDAGPADEELAPHPERPDWMQPDPQRLRNEIEAEKESKTWQSIVEQHPKDFNMSFERDYLERRKTDPNAREPHPPYDENVPAYAGIVGKGGRKFIRVFAEDGYIAGAWLMTPERFEKIRELPNATALLKDAFAVRDEPEFYTVVQVPEGTEIRWGGVNEHPPWGRGGEVQYEIVGPRDKTWYSEARRIKP